ncbi:MAG: rod shape-determining protein MreC [Candidatus Electryoneaceae bacterium]|nr:rod shape-determining protein MreC [Candidatus Electryoneaceae bacterium]
MSVNAKGYIPYLITTIVSFLLIFSSQCPQVDLLRGKAGDVVAILAYPVSGIIKIGHLWKNNRMMSSTLAEMTIHLGHLQSSGVENEHLRCMLGFKERTQYELITAEVIGTSLDPGVRGILINCGEVDGVMDNQAVILPEGIVGRVYRTGKHSASVQLILDHNIGVAGRLLRSRESGIVHSSSQNYLMLDGIPITASMEVGDTVVTSGLDGVFPPGVPIGTTANVNPASNGWLWNVEVTPMVKFGRLEQVFLVRMIRFATRGDSAR